MRMDCLWVIPIDVPKEWIPPLSRAPWRPGALSTRILEGKGRKFSVRQGKKGALRRFLVDGEGLRRAAPKTDDALSI